MTEQEKLINVDLYGDGSRDSRLRAEYIYCDHADVCSVYKEGKCFRKTTLFGVRCEFGRIACVDGGTKKTKMYGRVYSEAKDSERYHKLSYPNNTYIAKIGDGAFLAPPHVRIERGPESGLFCHNPGFGCNRLFVPIDELTPDNINRICTYHPRARLIIPPCKVGDTVWVITGTTIKLCTVDRIHILGNGQMQIRAKYFVTDNIYLYPDMFGKTVFLTCAEAEAAIEARKGDKE